MPPKGGNAKKESGRTKKAENEAKKQASAAAEKEHQETTKWSKGAKSENPRVAEEKARKEAAAARKAEAARLLAEEEAAIGGSGKPKVPKAGSSKKPVAAVPRPAGPGALGAGGGLEGIGASASVSASGVNTPSGSGKGKGPASPAPASVEVGRVVESFQATGIDDALDLLEVVNSKTDKASMGTAAAEIERHPERRYKAAFEAYLEREMPEIREERPGLRLQQYRDLLAKQFQKSPDNPFNQTTVAYDASKTERLDALKRKQEEVEERLREKKGGGSGKA